MKSRFAVVVAALSVAACFTPVSEDPNVALRLDAGWTRDASHAGLEETVAECTNGADDDGDGRIDCDDPDCWLSCHPEDGGRPWPDAGGQKADAGRPGSDASLPDAGPRRDGGCVPRCAPGACGDDGCGGSCRCPSDRWCEDGVCVGCVGSCAGRECGEDGCGNSCGLCADGQVCNPAGTCASPACQPPVGPCGVDQYCDTTGADPMCVEICGPVGCLPSEVCVHDSPTTGHCQPPTCAGLVCEQGQTCGLWGSFKDCTSDPQCSAPDRCVVVNGQRQCAHDACSCMPTYIDDAGIEHADTCLEYGLVCDMDLGRPIPDPAKCRMPVEFEECTPAVGCAPLAVGRLDCMAFTGFNLCLRSCANGAVADSRLCVFDYTTCIPSGTAKNHCYPNVCADPSCVTGTAGCTADKERAKYFKPCSSVGPNDSTCVQFAYDDHTDIGFCFQGGTAPRGGECTPSWQRSEPAPYALHCQPPVVDSTGAVTTPGEYCMSTEAVDPSDPDTAYRGICRPVCNANLAPVPALNCANGSVCLDTILDPLVPKTWMGLCVPACDLFGAGPCANDALGNRTGCAPTYDYQGSGWCAATVDAPGAEGGACSASATEIRNTCGDRLWCAATGAQATGTCERYCRSALCPDPKAPCADCGGAKCQPLADDGAGNPVNTPVEGCAP